MAVAFVSTVTQWGSASAVTSSASGSFTPTVGNAVPAYELESGSSGVTLSITGTGVYSRAIAQFNPSGTFLAFAAANLNVAGSAQTVTVNSTVAEKLDGWAFQYSGVVSASGSSATRVNPGTGAGAITGNAVNVPTGGVLLALCIGSISTTISSPSGTSRSSGTATVGAGVGWAVTEYAGAGANITPTFTDSTNGGAATYAVLQILLSPQAVTYGNLLEVLQSHDLRSRHVINADTSQGTPKALIKDFAEPRTPVLQQQLFRRDVVDTSQASPLALIIRPFPLAEPGWAPYRFWWQPPDTSLSTPKTLYADAFRPVQDYQHTAPDRVRPVTDTTTFEPKSLYGDVNIAFKPAPHLAPLRFFWQPLDTSLGSTAFIPSAAIPPPIPFLSPVRYWWQPADTSQSMPKVLFADAFTPVVNPPQFLIDPIRPVYDTSKGSPAEEILPVAVNPPHFAPLKFWWQPPDTSQATPKTLYADSFTPVFNPPQYLVDPIRPVYDTSHGTPAEEIQPPIFNPPWFTPLRFWFQPADTSQSTPKALYGDALFPFENYQHTAPDRVRPVTDTSTFLSNVLFGDVNFAFVPPPHYPPLRFWWQPADTSQSTPKAFYADALTPTFDAPQFQVDRIRPVTDTSQASSTALLSAQGPFSNAPQFMIAPVWPVVDTSQSSPNALINETPFTAEPGWAPLRYWFQPQDSSQSTPKVLYSDANAAFIPPPHFPPLKFWWQPPDTSQSTPKVLFGDTTEPTFNVPQYQIDPIRPVYDTSHGSPVTLLPAPFLPILHSAPARALWQPADTSQSTAKALYNDATTPIFNYQHTPPDRIRPVVDTSQGTPYEMAFFVGRPTVPPPHLAPLRFWWQPLDTCQSTPFPTSFVPPVFTRGNTVRAGVWN